MTGVTEYEKIVLPMMKSQEHPSVVLSGKSLFPNCCVRLYRDFSFFSSWLFKGLNSSSLVLVYNW